MTCGIVCIFFALHLLWWERCRVFWRAVWSGISAIVRWTLWPVCYLYRKVQMLWKAWKEHRKKRRIIAEFDRLHPELKDKYTDYGKLQFMRLAQDTTFQRINKLRHASSCLLTPSVCVLPYKKACHTVTVTVT